MDPVRPAIGMNSDKICSKIVTIYRELHIRNIGLRYKVQITLSGT